MKLVKKYVCFKYKNLELELELRKVRNYLFLFEH